ncbi:MAG TPA: efflux RND transporter periplasmic adaptor subunit [Dokdonella sp.]|uniref:efflux RND transporter periplasmic adaptor subunit n=1 Tax=Dokdonella sp. TaxID=2291710 RepID=UPI002D806DB9|nr:efflux RND transporter periplasmic adaptor subunit [Dokdonella sp.]HET9033191.1 efflux RND transporter periplasmic adaptor subunit [Dokdonella sp.]
MRHFVIAGLLVALTACSSGTPEEAGEKAAAIPVTTTVVEPTSWVDSIEAVGTTKASESVTLTTKITETVRKVNFTDGQHVDAGDVLVELTSGQQVAALAEAQATYKDAERLMERNDDLVRQGTVSKQVADTARATHDSAKARVALLRAQLADRVVTAPFSGVLGLRQVSVGALVSPGTVITTLDDIETINLDFSLSERYFAKLTKGLELTATAVAYPGRKFSGHVVSVDSRVDPLTRSVLVRAEIPNPDHALRAGMLMTVNVLQPAREVLAVPEIAIEQVGTGSYVYIVGSDNTVARVEVSLGERQDGRVEVTRGVEAGARVVVDGTVKLRDGSMIVDATPAKAASQ